MGGAAVRAGPAAQRLVRSVHRAFFWRAMPEKLGLYLHATTGGERDLDSLLGFLQDQGYGFCGPDEFLSAAGKVAFLSFDDNYRSWLRALPVLDRRRARATFYVNSWPFRDRVGAAEIRAYLDRIRAPDETTLSVPELIEIADAGHVIGAHTHTHPVLSRLSRTQAQQEIRVSKEELEQMLQRPVRHFSYPFGMRRHFSGALRRYCLSIGFSTVANGIPCLQHAASRPDNLHRSAWHLGQSMAENLDNICIDGRVFHALTGRSAAGGSSPA